MFDALLLNFSDLSQIYNCTFFRWQPKIGDPHIMGWITVVCYVLTAALCVAVQARATAGHKAMRLFWIALAALMVFLAINKQLDLQSLATAVARCTAKLQGWYQERRAFQIQAILGLGISAVLVGLFFLWFIRKDLKPNFLALLGLTVVFGFVLIRAVGFHHFDAILNTKIISVRMNWILELSGLVLISLNAIILLSTRSKSRSVVKANPEHRSGAQ